MNKEFEKRLTAIEARNKRVEDDKAWETSSARRVVIAVITYALVGLYLTWLEVARPWLNAVVPALGFMLSTLAIQFVKEFWLSRRK